MSYSVYMESFVLISLSCVYLIMGARSVEKGGEKQKNFRTLCIVVFVIYIVALLSMALFERTLAHKRYLDLTPFGSYYKILTCYACLDVYKQIIDNILVFIPFGMLFPRAAGLKSSKRAFAVTAAAGCALSLLIEASQYVFSLGYSEVDDVINNTFGCIIGIGVFAFSENLSISGKTITLKDGWLKCLMPAVCFCFLMFLIDIYREYVLLSWR
ncbi:MAG: VanZ family protein [Acutalibacteraceae bacterium]